MANEKKQTQTKKKPRPSFSDIHCAGVTNTKVHSDKKMTILILFKHAYSCRKTMLFLELFSTENIY